MKKNKNIKMILLFLVPVAFLYISFFIYPLAFVLGTSLTEWNGISAMKFIGLGNYKKLLTDGTFLLSIKNNIIWALSGGFIQIPLATMVALILARKPRGWKTLRTIYFLPNIISAVAIAMMWKAIYNPMYGFLNAFLNLFGIEGHNWLGETATALPAVIAQTVLYIGYFMVIIFAATTTIPKSFYEAAEIDGCTTLQQEWYITLPMIRGILVTTITLAMAYGMRHFEATFLMTSGGPAHSTSVMGLVLYNKMDAFRLGEANATGTILILLGTVVIVLIRKLLSRGDAGSDSVQ
ncbi:carbohydrate ABC transporter permease [Spirochaeta isovalerica]|uniref:Raffinose/stachyose/melibiose transport system permease protein n=1 Tax=Spirochaeta isovalerica TaxID=150 RepID=A0A841RH44_9SPIO|nr:sugar ABC transporter permease [Spirochaeta isovalerica]MBB6482517.1 raffinose/stachyose/melibiose transport system permease protein [Spirochaeta isovalerica]